jgi:hypothetical protein
MKPSRCTEEQIIGILREQEAGAKTADMCRKHGAARRSTSGRPKNEHSERRCLAQPITATAELVMVLLRVRRSMAAQHLRFQKAMGIPGGQNSARMAGRLSTGRLQVRSLCLLFLLSLDSAYGRPEAQCE